MMSDQASAWLMTDRRVQAMLARFRCILTNPTMRSDVRKAGASDQWEGFRYDEASILIECR